MSVICCLSGKKQSGKNTAANYIAAKFLMYTNQISDFRITSKGLLECRLQINGETNWITIQENDFNNAPFSSIKLYSFADPLKLFCMDVFGLTYEQCYGTDEQKNSRTTLKWGDMPGYDNKHVGTTVAEFDPSMTAREVLQYFGTNVVREMLGNAWVNATINKIKREAPKLALISDARFPNEIAGIMQAGGMTIRLLRNVAGIDEHKSETALDDFPADKYTFVLDKRLHTIDDQCEALNPIIDDLMKLMTQGS